MRKPVITNDKFGGSVEIIKNKSNGFLVDSDLEEIYSLILKLLNDKTYSEKIGYNARLFIEKEMSVKSMGDNFQKIYTKLI